MPVTISVRLEAVDQPERCQAHAVDRRAVARVADGPVLDGISATHSGRRIEIERAVADGSRRRDHRQLDVLERDERTPQRLQALGVDPVVVGRAGTRSTADDSTDGQLRNAIVGHMVSIRWGGDRSGHVPYCSSGERCSGARGPGGSTGARRARRARLRRRASATLLAGRGAATRSRHASPDREIEADPHSHRCGRRSRRRSPTSSAGTASRRRSVRARLSMHRSLFAAASVRL